MFNVELIENEINRKYYHNYVDIGSNGVNDMYQIVLSRRPDLIEIEPYLNALKLGVPPKKLMRSIMYSKEGILKNRVPPEKGYFSLMKILFRPKNNFIKHTYLQVLNRQPLDQELSTWMKKQKYLPRLLIILLFFRAVEYRNNYKLCVLSETLYIISYKTYRLLILSFIVFKNKLKTFFRITKMFLSGFKK